MYLNSFSLTGVIDKRLPFCNNFIADNSVCSLMSLIESDSEYFLTKATSTETQEGFSLVAFAK
jgi:hypothetical protein